MIPAETLIAYADGELDAEAAAEVEAAAARDPEVAAGIDAHRRLKARLAAAFGPVAEDPVPDRLLGLLADPPAAGPAPVQEAVVVPFARRPLAGGHLRPVFIQAAAMAACLVAGVGVTLLATRPSGDIVPHSGALVARGDLAHALSTQLASQDAGAVRIGVTFRDTTGAMCRTFTGSPGDGLACRTGGDWRIDVLTRGEAKTDYRQAASPLVMQAVSERAAGDSFDAAQEKAALASGWK